MDKSNEMAALAENLWNNYIKQKISDEIRENKVSYYIATVTSNNGSGSLRIRAPFDNERSANCTKEMENVAVDTKVLVMKFGEGASASNHVVFASLAGASPQIKTTGNAQSARAFNRAIAVSKTRIPVDEVAMSTIKYVYGSTTDGVPRNRYISQSMLTEVSLTACVVIESSAFEYCPTLTTAAFPVCKSIYSSAFAYDYNLVDFYLDQVSSVTTLGTGVFYSTPIGGYSESTGRYGSVFVPSSLYTAFRTATNWVSISARLVSV